MKKLSLILMGLISFASADLLSVSAGAGIWKQDISGYIKSNNVTNYFNDSSQETPINPNTGNFGLETKNNPFVWIKFIHPVPIIPNIKLQYTKYDSTGHSNYIAAGSFSKFGITLNGALTNATTTQTINSYDLTLFYEFKPVIVDIEAGFGIDYWKSKTTIYGTDTITNTTKTWVNENWDLPLPYLYGHIETMKLFGFSLIGNIKYAKYKENYHHDYSLSIKYTIDIPGPINPFIKAGYRIKEVYGTSDNTTIDIKYKGGFAEIGLKF